MRYIIGLLLVLGLAGLGFAQSWCEESCCDSAGGTWDSDYEYCSGADSSYYTCTSDYCSQGTSTGSNSSGSSSSCCGSGFILMSVIGGAMFVRAKVQA